MAWNPSFRNLCLQKWFLFSFHSFSHRSSLPFRNFSSSANLIPLWSPLSKLTIQHYHNNLQILFKTQFCNRARALTSRPSNPLRRVRTPRRTVPPFRSIPISGTPLSQRRFSFSLLFAFAGSTSIETLQNGTTPSMPSASEPSSLLLVHTSTLRRSITTAFRDSTRHFGSATSLWSCACSAFSSVFPHWLEWHVSWSFSPISASTLTPSATSSSARPPSVLRDSSLTSSGLSTTSWRVCITSGTSPASVSSSTTCHISPIGPIFSPLSTSATSRSCAITAFPSTLPIQTERSDSWTSISATSFPTAWRTSSPSDWPTEDPSSACSLSDSSFTLFPSMESPGPWSTSSSTSSTCNL